MERFIIQNREGSRAGKINETTRRADRYIQPASGYQAGYSVEIGKGSFIKSNSKFEPLFGKT
jgi:hypothetical protein